MDSETFLAQVKALAPELVAMRRHLHRHPEVSGCEVQTALYIEQRLAQWGIPTRRIGETGVLGTLCGQAPRPATLAADAPLPAVALRADIDALPITETADVPYASCQAGAMHACGHDAHAACLLGAAAWLAQHRELFYGEVRLVFQPAEERGAGAKDFLRAGALDGVYRLFGLHMAPDVPCGVIGLKPGLNNASVDHFTIEITGRAAHVSTPQLGADALYIASQTVVALQGVVTRLYSPVEPVILGIGCLQAGTAYNIVAASARLEGTTRAVTTASRALLKQQIDRTAADIAALYGGQAAVTWEDFGAPLINDAAACGEAAALAARLWGEAHVQHDRALSLGGDNFADLQAVVPGVYAYLGSANAARPATCLPLHNDGFDLDEDALPMGAGMHIACALHWLAAAAGAPSPL